MCPPLLLAQSGQLVTEAFFKYAAALINVNESAGKRGGGHGPRRRELVLSEMERSALPAHAASQDRPTDAISRDHLCGSELIE
jgi:hypothetical protein